MTDDQQGVCAKRSDPSDFSDPLPLAQALIRCASVTPADAGAQAVLAEALERLGFTVTRLRYGDDREPVRPPRHRRARISASPATPTWCRSARRTWRHDPFAAEVHDGVLYGRGACDMKGGIAAFVAAAARPASAAGPPRGSISLLITGDEEGDAIDGTVRVLEWMRDHDQIPDFCLVGEPTCPVRLGDMVKIGRRGSLNAKITVHGTQGHVAYPHRADNPVHRLLRALNALTAAPVDAGTDWFEPSTLQVTSHRRRQPGDQRDPGRGARAAEHPLQRPPHRRRAVRLAARHAGAARGERFDLDIAISGESFVTQPGAGRWTCSAPPIAARPGSTPKLDTGGGTSDARFIARYCPVAEFGLVGASMHQADECVPVDELRAWRGIYRGMLSAFLAVATMAAPRPTILRGSSVLRGIVRVALRPGRRHRPVRRHRKASSPAWRR